MDLAYAWDAKERFNMDIIKQYAKQFQNKSQEQLVRTFIRGLVSLLDIVEQNKDLDILQEMENITFTSI